VIRTAVAAIRTTVGWIAIVLYTLILGSYVIVLTWFRPGARHIEPLARSWARLFGFVAGSKEIIEGRDLIDADRSYVYVANHISNLDPMLLIANLPGSIRFLAKKELFKIPVFGRAMRAVGMVETDRRAASAAHRSINRQVARVIEMKRSLAIYAEGTRSRDAELRPFKKGAFRIAVENQMPVVPLVIAGADKGWKPGSKVMRSSTVRLVIHDPIPTADLGRADIGPLRDRVRSIIEKTYAEIRDQVV
jgi:1-acyl-sn-glycerol-3-phosphate acyltransferase